MSTHEPGSYSQLFSCPSFASMPLPHHMGPSFELWIIGGCLPECVVDAFSRLEHGYVLCNAYGPTKVAINASSRLHYRNVMLGCLIRPPPTQTCATWVSGRARLMRFSAGERMLARSRSDQSVCAEVDGCITHVIARAGQSGSWSGIECLGRILGMDQVKLGGRHVELGEIETMLFPLRSSRRTAIRQIEDDVW
ncbi:uncharacterized protein EV420DRAFT_1533265 [Desarmillaria tabescens]|uniref:Uncharacterized protein n=1 Tax=Armillaria tabescens TaxID=1929756 RepID=A0AA39N7V2_ARMTA|nr:uncharacterized protein EV420DRAFT_1533265 [Desarmillaria tabescens]KAK0460640.1 hypothetical protein EV420DRAFT_1533265 [Desarmillaria tabescens]